MKMGAYLTNWLLAKKLARRKKGVTAADLASAAGISTSAARRLLVRMEEAGLMVGEPAPSRKGKKRGDWRRVWRQKVGGVNV